MSRTTPDALPGLDEARAALAAGGAAVVPNPSPMTYGLVATDPGTVNRLKGRPLDQNVGVSVHDPASWQQVRALLALSPGTVSLVETLLAQRLSLLVPLGVDTVPDWLRAARRADHLAVFSGRWEPTASLWDAHPWLYGSSANRSGHRPAATAAEAREAFGADIPVVDGDALRETTGPHAASTMVRVTTDGTLAVHRSGAQDQVEHLDEETFLRGLTARGPDR